MWYRIKYSSEEQLESGRTVHYLNYYLTDADNFAEAGYKVMQLFNGEGEVEDVCLMKTYKPLGNDKYSDDNKVYIVKVAQDFEDETGKVKTIKYPVPFYANNATELQHIVEDYIKQGLDDMRITTISETKWEII